MAVRLSHPPERLVGRFQLLRRIARGAVGEVYVARELGTQRNVALKRLLPSQKRPLGALFRAEYHTLARLRHPSIVTVFEFGVEAGLPYYTMELLDGEDLGETAPVPYDVACRYLRDVASALSLLHAQRLLHRDISPRNVRRTRSGRCKLLDFGALASFGVPSNLAGTLPFLSPEAWQGAVLDQRSDLYSLGALAHWLLTGSVYSSVHQTLLIDAPRRDLPEIPSALKALVMSLLESDPAKRPTSAAEVILRLNAIAELEPDNTPEVAQSYVTSSRFVGREQELSELGQQLLRLQRGAGGAVLIEGAVGTGKTRLLQELALMAQTQGLTVVRGSAARTGNRPKLAQQLYRSLQRAMPESFEQLPPQDQAEFAALESETGGQTAPLRDDADAAARLHWALGRYFLGAEKRGPYVLLIDNLELADEFSSAFVAALARHSELCAILVVVTASPLPTARRPASIQALSRFAHRLSLRDLSRGMTFALCGSLFGDVPNLERLASCLHQAAHGNPGLIIELSHLLLQRGAVRYVDGAFVLPQGEVRDLFPSDVTTARLLRLESLSEQARACCGLIAVCRDSVPLSRCLLLCEGTAEDILCMLDEAVRAGILIFDRHTIRYAQEALRQAVRASISPAHAQKIHRSLAELILAEDRDSAWSQLEAGWHLAHTDSALSGAHMIAQVAPGLIEAGVALSGVISAAEKGLQVLEASHQSLAVRLTLRTALTRAAYLYDYRLAERYGADTADELYRLTYFRVVNRARPRAVRSVLFYSVMLVATLRNLFQGKATRGPNAVVALTYLGRTLSSLLALRAMQLDSVSAKALLSRMEPLCLSPASFPGRASYLACRAFALGPLGRESELHAALQDALAAINDKSFARLTPSQRRDLRTGLLLSDGLNECFRLGGPALSRADALARHDWQIAHAAALRIRLTYYAVRGMREEVERYRRLLDLHGIQGGTTWQVEWFAVPIEGMASALFGDIVSARHDLDRLERLSDELPSLRPMRDMVRIACHYRQGDFRRAVEAGEAFIKQHPPRSMIGWATGYAAVAASLCELGEADKARKLADEAIAQVPEADREFVIMYGPLGIEQAVAYAVLGDASVMNELMATWGARCEQAGEHSLLLMVHEGRARAARLTNDSEKLFEALHDLAETASRAKSRSVRLLAQRMAQDALRAAGRHGAPVTAFDMALGATALAPEPGPSPSAPEARAPNPLRTLVRESGLSAAYLFVADAHDVQLVSACVEELPSHFGELLSPTAPTDLSARLRDELPWIHAPRQSERAPAAKLVSWAGQAYQLLALSRASGTHKALLVLASTGFERAHSTLSAALLDQLAQAAFTAT